MQQRVETEIPADAPQASVVDRNIQTQVVTDGAAEQERVLKHDTQLTTQLLHRQAADVTTVQQDPTLLGFIQAAEQTNHRALAGPGRSHQSHVLSRCNSEVEIAQDRFVGAVGKAHVLEHHFTAGSSGRSELADGALLGRLGVVDDLERLLEQLANALNGGESSLDLGEALCQLAQWIEQTLGIKDERCEGAQSHRPCCHHPSTQGQHQGNSPKSDPFNEGRNAAVEKDRAIHSPAVGQTGGVEAFTIHGLPPEHLHHLKTLQVLLEIRIELREFLPHPVVGFAIAALEPEDHQGDWDLGSQQQQSQSPFHQQHGDRNHHKAHQITQHTNSPTTKHLGKGIHITRQPGEQLAHRHAVVKADRKIDRVGEEVFSNAGREPLAHRLNVEGLHPLKPQTQEH